MPDVFVGFDRDDPVTNVLVPIGHLAIFGQTRRAGKTTSLRTLVGDACAGGRANALIFRTGKSEISFPDAHRLPAFFREKFDWRSVESMLWTFLSERPKVYRPIVMRAVHGARSLEEVHARILKEGKASKSAWVRDRTYELDVYLKEILPWLREHQLVQTLELEPGENVVDLEGWPVTVQQLVIAATLDKLMEQGRRGAPLLVVLPEARKFMPHDRATPTRPAVDLFTREGAKLNLFLWIDSQALTGVDQQALRNFALILQGVQTSDIEIDRICDALEGVKPKLVRSLKVGDFILHTEDGVRVVHVPLAKAAPAPVSMGIGRAESTEIREPGEDVDAKERKRYEEEAETQRRVIARLQDDVVRLREQVRRAEHERAQANERAAAASEFESNAAPGSGERVQADVHLYTEPPDLTVHVKRVRVDARDDSNLGRIGLLISEGFFDSNQSTGPIGKEFEARGWGNPIAAGGSQGQALRDALREMCSYGFLRELNRMWVVVPEAKTRIRTLEEA